MVTSPSELYAVSTPFAKSYWCRVVFRRSLDFQFIFQFHQFSTLINFHHFFTTFFFTRLNVISSKLTNAIQMQVVVLSMAGCVLLSTALSSVLRHVCMPYYYAVLLLFWFVFGVSWSAVGVSVHLHCRHYLCFTTQFQRANLLPFRIATSMASYVWSWQVVSTVMQCGWCT